ncbi:MAG: hypothetical protein ABSF46_24140 [Terriglobia bacterium]|jgi:hydroxymethylpyrimidine pyrophosphatase-like HAD family hydrolase
MPVNEFTSEAKRLITERCLIAADIDQTLLVKGADRERQHFLETLAPELLRAAALGVNLAFLTGNSMHELSSRFLSWLIDQLVHTGRLDLLERFHFFSNSAGVYAHFPALGDLANGLPTNLKGGATLETILSAIFVEDGQKGVAIRPRFIDAGYIERSIIPEDDSKAVLSILNDGGLKYMHDLTAKKSSYQKTYDLSQVSDDSRLREPKVDLRIVEYGSDTSPGKATVQLTLKPILSFRHAHKPSSVFGRDLRIKLVERIQEALDEKGLGHLVVRPGGLSSIDVALEKVDKAYALEFLIDRLNLSGSSRKGQKFGSNAIYIGDEVIVGGGNDYPVTRIPGLLVFAVNQDKGLIPFLSHVFVPSAILVGPDATADVLADFNKCAVRLLKESELAQVTPRFKTALEAFKEDIFVNRIRETISSLTISNRTSADDWQTLHAFVTLMSRNDPAAGHWLSMLINELDSIMTQLTHGALSGQSTLGIGGQGH